MLYTDDTLALPNVQMINADKEPKTVVASLVSQYSLPFNVSALSGSKLLVSK